MKPSLQSKQYSYAGNLPDDHTCYNTEREIRRGHRYDAIIMDPPSYGRGPGGEVWKLENELFGLVSACEKVLAQDAQS